MNFTLPTALVERAQSLPPYSLLANQLLSAPLPHGLIRPIRVLTTQLSTNLDPHLGFIGLALAIVICIIWICYQVGQEAKAHSEQVKNYKVLELAYQDAAALNDILRKANEDLQGRNDHLSSTLSSTFDVIIRQGDRVQELTRDFEQVTERSEFFEGSCKVLVLENNRLAQVNTNLRGQNHNLGCQLNASKTRCNRLLGEVDKYGTRNQQLEDAAKVLQSERNEAVQELGSVKCDHDALAQRAEDYQIRAGNSEKAHADSQSEVERMVAENSRLATVHRDTKLRHEQEKAEMTEQLAKANKELHGLKSLPKSTKPPKSAAQKQLENENAKLKSDLKQGEQEKEALRKANEDSSSRFESLEEKWKQSQEEAEAARVTINRLEEQANERETARDAQEKKSRAELDVLVSEKSTAEMELKTAKEEKCALAKKVTELSTPSPPSRQNAQGMNDTLRPRISLISQFLALPMLTISQLPSSPLHTNLCRA